MSEQARRTMTYYPYSAGVFNNVFIGNNKITPEGHFTVCDKRKSMRDLSRIAIIKLVCLFCVLQ